jgi:hypothetical protein
MQCSLTVPNARLRAFHMSDPFTKIKFIAYLWRVYRTALPWNLAWERNQRRLTVGGVAHPKAVERGANSLLHGTHVAQCS